MQHSMFQNRGESVKYAFLLALLLIATEREAAAYTDPGTGALIWQMVAAGFVGVLFYFRKITAFFSRSRQDKEPAE